MAHVGRPLRTDVLSPRLKSLDIPLHVRNLISQPIHHAMTLVRKIRNSVELRVNVILRKGTSGLMPLHLLCTFPLCWPKAFRRRVVSIDQMRQVRREEFLFRLTGHRSISELVMRLNP